MHTSLWQMTSSVVGQRRRLRIRHLRAPGGTGRRHVASTDIVQPTHQRRRGGQGHVALGPTRIGRRRDVAPDELEPLTSIRVDTDWPAGRLEALVAQEPQEVMDRLGVWTRGAEHVLAVAHDEPGVGHSPMQDLDTHHTVRLRTPRTSVLSVGIVRCDAVPTDRTGLQPLWAGSGLW